MFILTTITRIQKLAFINILIEGVSEIKKCLNVRQKLGTRNVLKNLKNLKI